MATLLVVGLGNPGAQYEHTRHNIGWMLVDLLAERFGVKLREESALKGVYGEITLKGHRLALLRPLTFMNLSGQSAQAAADKLGIESESVICAVDEIQLDTGRLKLSSGGSAGGHNGLTSMIAELGGDSFRRMRLGVGPYRKDEHEGGLKAFVLSRFTQAEETFLKATLELGADAIAEWLEEGGEDAGFVKATSFGNAKSRQPKLLAAKAPETPMVQTEEAKPAASTTLDAKEEETPKRPSGIFGWLKALFGRRA